MERSLRYVLARTVWALVTIFVAVTINFVLFRAIPGDATANIARIPGTSAELRKAVTEEFQLDESKWDQYVAYLGQLAHGNLGVSFQDRQPVADHLSSAIGNTLPMVGVGLLLALALGIASGVFAAFSRGTRLHEATVGPALAFYAIPVQWLGLMLILLLSGTLPAGGREDAFALNQTGWEHTLDVAEHMILPSLTFALVAYGQFTLVVRSAMLEELGEDYVLTARAKGLPNRRILRRHALRNAMLPVSTIIALSIGTLVGGAVLIEAVFSWPGIGIEMYQSVLTRDYPVLQGAFLLITASVVLCNYIADLLYLWLDPRLRT
jgi:ABC-type dipeptide/oligopeptide/nickel transport system permease component